MAQISYITLYMLHQNTRHSSSLSGKAYSHILARQPNHFSIITSSLRHYLALTFFNVKRDMEAQMRRHADYAYFVPNSS